MWIEHIKDQNRIRCNNQGNVLLFWILYLHKCVECFELSCVFDVLQVHGGKGENKHRQLHVGGSAQQVGISLTSSQ